MHTGQLTAPGVDLYKGTQTKALYYSHFPNKIFPAMDVKERLIDSAEKLNSQTFHVSFQCSFRSSTPKFTEATGHTRQEP